MIFFYKKVNDLAPKYLADIIPLTNNSRYSTRSQTNSEVNQFYTRTESFQNSFSPIPLLSFPCLKMFGSSFALVLNLALIFAFSFLL